MFRAVLVDDSADLRSLTHMTLEFESDADIVGEASSGREGLELIGRLHPDVAVIDLHMPGMHGVDLIRFLRHAETTTRLVAYSNDELALGEALRAGADAAVLKTADVNELLTAIAC